MTERYRTPITHPSSSGGRGCPVEKRLSELHVERIHPWQQDYHDLSLASSMQMFRFISLLLPPRRRGSKTPRGIVDCMVPAVCRGPRDCRRSAYSKSSGLYIHRGDNTAPGIERTNQRDYSGLWRPPTNHVARRKGLA